MIKLLLVDSQDVVSEDSITMYFHKITGFRIVGEASTLKEAVEITAQRSPDILLMDGNLLLKTHQKELTRSIRHIMNQYRAKIIVFVDQIYDKLLISRLISTKISALIKKDTVFYSLGYAMRDVLEGHRYLSNSMASQIDMADLSYFAQKAIVFPFHILD